METQRCLHERCDMLSELQMRFCPEGRHTMLMLLGCLDCRIGVPFPHYNFALLTSDEQDELLLEAAQRGFGWDAARYPLNPDAARRH